MTRARAAAIGALACLVAACGKPRPVPEAAVAGGETSEFSGGDIAFCPEEGATFIELALDSEQVSPWVALAEGHHETSLAWQRAFASDALRGYEEHTAVALDVTVLSARDVIFGDANLGYEGEACEGSRQRQIRLAVDLRTADGALGGSFEHWVTPGRDPSAPSETVLASTSKADNGLLPFSTFASTLELEVQRFVEQRREIRVSLAFDHESVRGMLEPYIWTLEPAGEVGPGTVRPLRAVFPDDGCSPTRPVALDQHRDELGETPRAAYERTRATLEQAPLRAGWWQNYPSARRDAGYEWTELTLRAGEPARACASAGSVRVHAPLTLETADGLVQHTQTVSFDLRDGSWTSDGSSPLLPVADFERTTGLRGFDFTGIEWAGVYLSGYGLTGYFGATQWEQTEQRYMDPILEWCAEPNCQSFWCMHGVDVDGVDCR